MTSIRRTASLAIFAAALPPIANAQAAKFRSGHTCYDLRTKVSEYGSDAVLAAARSRGISEQDIANIRRKRRV